MRSLAIFAAVAIAWSGSAAAQVSDPYRNQWARSGPITLPGDSSRKNPVAVMRGFARCIVALHPDAARRFVLLSLNSWVPEKDYGNIRDSRCMGLLSGRLMMGQLAYRGALAEELLRWDFTHLDPSALVSAPILDWSVPDLTATDPRTGQTLTERARAAREKGHDIAIAGSTIGALAECVIRRAPSASRAVLKTGSEPDERAAFQAIVPDIGQCAQTNGTTTFSRASLRQALALSYYRLAASAAGRSQRAAK
jgi:hypothetical protein